jgi:hypothetical protein
MELLWSPVGVGVLWLVLHTADYVLTIAAARMRAKLGERVRLGGSLELNPLFQQVVERGQWVSKRFVATLALGLAAFSGGVAYFQWTAQTLGLPWIAVLPEAVVGALCVTRMAVVANHLHNLVLFRRMLHVPEAAEVSVRYDRGTVMVVSRSRMLEVAAFCAVALLVSGRPFYAGGLFGVLGIAGATFLWARRQQAVSPPRG